MKSENPPVSDVSDIGVYDGTPIEGLIAGHTNPWVEVDGVPVDWTTIDLPRVQCPCEDMGQVVEPGVLDGMDTPEGVQRCDGCGIYESDLDAALALAKRVGGVVKFMKEDTR